MQTDFGTQITGGQIKENQEDNANNATETINSFISEEDIESSDYEDDNNLHLHIGEDTPAGFRMSKTTAVAAPSSFKQAQQPKMSTFG